MRPRNAKILVRAGIYASQHTDARPRVCAAGRYHVRGKFACGAPEGAPHAKNIYLTFNCEKTFAIPSFMTSSAPTSAGVGVLFITTRCLPRK